MTKPHKKLIKKGKRCYFCKKLIREEVAYVNGNTICQDCFFSLSKNGKAKKGYKKILKDRGFLN